MTFSPRGRTKLLPEFELGLELDSAEVRGILLYDNQEWGRSVGPRPVLTPADM